MSNALDEVLKGVSTDAKPDTSLSFEAFGIPIERGNQLESDVFDSVVAAVKALVDENGTAKGNWASLYKDHVKPLAKNAQEELFCALVFGQVRMHIRSTQEDGGGSGVMQLLKLMAKMGSKGKK